MAKTYKSCIFKNFKTYEFVSKYHSRFGTTVPKISNNNIWQMPIPINIPNIILFLVLKFLKKIISLKFWHLFLELFVPDLLHGYGNICRAMFLHVLHVIIKSCQCIIHVETTKDFLLAKFILW
jgi:hypothetical protein